MSSVSRTGILITPLGSSQSSQQLLPGRPSTDILSYLSMGERVTQLDSRRAAELGSPPDVKPEAL